MNSGRVFERSDIIGDYSVQFFIEKKGGSEIYRVIDKDGNLGRLKAYKLESFSSSRFSIDNIKKEVEFLSEIDNPLIEKIISSGEFFKNEVRYFIIVTNFISGETCLEKLKREGALNPYAVVAIILNLLKALDYLHSLDDPIIHNDLTIENIVLNYSSNKEIPIITNFSSAIHLSKTTQGLKSDLLNPYYMSPEQMNGISLIQSDMYAVGVLMYHLCFGVYPWLQDVESREELISKLKISRVEDLKFYSEHLEIFDDHLLTVIRKSLHYDINKRFLNASEFIAALNRDVKLTAEEYDDKVIIGNKKIGNGFSDIAGMASLKEVLNNDVICALKEKKLYQSYGITIPNGILLYGPPGCGKTFISEKFAEEVGFNFVQLSPSDVKSKYVNATEENVAKIFNDARENAPTIIFMDEIDALVPSRDANLHHMNASTVNEFLAQMSDCAKDDVFIIAATNRPDKIDKAILRTGRIDKKIFVSPPDLIAREQMFRLYLLPRPIDITIDYLILAEKTELFVSSDIKFIIDEASRIALKDNSKITQSIIEDVINSSNPSLSFDDLKYYKDLKNKLENKQVEPKEYRSIGFK